MRLSCPCDRLVAVGHSAPFGTASGRTYRQAIRSRQAAKNDAGRPARRPSPVLRTEPSLFTRRINHGFQNRGLGIWKEFAVRAQPTSRATSSGAPLASKTAIISIIESPFRFAMVSESYRQPRTVPVLP